MMAFDRRRAKSRQSKATGLSSWAAPPPTSAEKKPEEESFNEDDLDNAVAESANAETTGEGPPEGADDVNRLIIDFHKDA